ncbi:CD226 antigen [Orycteropus afer afer]|uniref:CD226 antigen n=1 Tax=Orycteropus afer afer TaxID=1230840 RepID=A0AC54ZD48_ORYAF|nr:CD226 antigen [Orycteropus afer afer]
MDYLASVFAILHVYKALGEEVFWDTTIKFAENMTLECMYPSRDTLTQVEWFKINATKKVSIAIFNPTYGAIIREPYADRVYFLNSTVAPNDMTISFYNASEADVGFYSCSLYTFPSGPWGKVIRVVQTDSFETAVSSANHLVSKPGKNITLTCQYQSKQPMQLVTWEKIQPHQIDLLTFCNLSQGRSYASRYQRQILTNCSQGMRGSFIGIPHLTSSDSGLYRCCFRASTGEEEAFAMRLTVAHGITNTRYVLFLTGGTVLLLLVTLIAIIAVIYCNRRRRQKRALFQASWETQNKMATNYRSPTSTNQPLDGTREDIYVNYPAFPRRPKIKV